MEALFWWGGFALVILLFLVLDLSVFHRRDHVISLKEALRWSAFWIFLALSFNAILLFTHDADVALDFLTGYVLEKLISVDNLFVFFVAFSYFNIPKQYQYRVLFWGMMGTLILRMLSILIGLTLFNAFSWVTYLFGFFLLVTGIYLFFQEKMGIDLKKNLFVRLLQKGVPLTHALHGRQFFAKVKGRWVMTPLLLVVFVIEGFDLFYSIESVPLIFSVTKDPFIVYTSNVFAILGLKSLYFVVSHFLYRFHYMRYALALVLTFVGFRMAFEPWIFISDWVVLGVVTISFATSIVLGPIFPSRGQEGKRQLGRR